MRLLPLADDGAAFPAVDLGNLSLRNLLRTVSVLGSCDLGGIQLNATAFSSTEVINSAARVLSSWPNNFFDLLARMSSREVGEEYDVRRQYAPLYNALLKRSPSSARTDFQFLRIALLSFVSDHLGSRVADPRLMSGIGDLVSRRYISRLELARFAGATQRAVTRVTKQNGVSGPGIAEVRGRVVVDRQRCAFPAPVPGNIFTIRKAAELIGIPVSLLRVLRERAVYEDIDMSPGLPGFHEGDVLRFRNRLAGVARDSQIPATECRDWVVWSDLMQGKKLSCVEKAGLIGAFLDGRLFCSQPTNGDMRNVSVAESQIRDLIAAVRNQAMEINGLQACSLLNCDFDTLRALIESGYLSATRAGGLWRISRHSALDFCNAYMPVAQLALALATSSSRIEAICSDLNISILRLTVTSGRARLYAHRTDIDLIKTIAGIPKHLPRPDGVD